MRGGGGGVREGEGGVIRRRRGGGEGGVMGGMKEGEVRDVNGLRRRWRERLEGEVADQTGEGLQVTSSSLILSRGAVDLPHPRDLRRATPPCTCLPHLAPRTPAPAGVSRKDRLRALAPSP